MSLLVLVVVLGGCRQMSIRESSEAAGFNGGFEVAESELPANWFFHYPPISSGDAQFSVDTSDAVEGRQSLKAVVQRVDPAGGWYTAGFFQVAPAEPLETYRVSFAVKNRGSRFRVEIDSERPLEDSHPDVVTLGPEDTESDTWRRFEYEYRVPETYENIRFQVTFVEPGTLWIDDVRIERLPTGRAG